MIDFDTMLVHVGEFGRYQKFLFILQAPFCIFAPFVLFGHLFLTLSPDIYWCQDSFNCTNSESLSPEIKQILTLRWLAVESGNETMYMQHACQKSNFSRNTYESLAAFLRSDRCQRSEDDSNSEDTTCPLNMTNVREFNNWIFGAENIDIRLGRGRRVKRQNHYDRARSWRPTNSRFGSNPTWYGRRNRFGNPYYKPWRQYYSQRGSTKNEPSGDIESADDGSFEDVMSEYAEVETKGYQSDEEINDEIDVKGTGNSKELGTTTYRPTWGISPSNPSVSTSGRDFPKSPQRPAVSSSSTTFRTSRPTHRPMPKPGNDITTSEADATLAGTNEENVNIDQEEGGRSNDPSVDPVNGMEEEILPGQQGFQREQELEEGCSTQLDIRIEDNTDFDPEAMFTLQEVLSEAEGSRSPEECQNIQWDRNLQTPRYDSIATEGNWWCNLEFYVTLSSSVFFLGAIVGAILIGYIADNFGRVPALVVANLLGGIGGILSVTTTDVYLFSFYRFITGMSFDNCFTMMYILVLEFCGAKYRTLVANLSIAIFYTLGSILVPWLAKWINDWRMYGLALALPMFSVLLAGPLTPESARWLLIKGKVKKSTKILRGFAKVNGKRVSEEIFQEFEDGAREEVALMKSDDSQKQGLGSAMKKPRLRLTIVLLIIIWCLIAIVYDGHSRNILNLANRDTDVFVMFTIASSTELPADLLVILTLDTFGRRWLSFASLLLSGAFSLISATIPPQVESVVLATAIASRFCVNFAFNIGLQYAAELLPTTIRAQGVNIIHMSGYGASLLSPVIAQIGRSERELSLIILGVFAITAAFLCLFLKETLGEDLPNTIEEGDNFGSNQSFWSCVAFDDTTQTLPKKDEEEDIDHQSSVFRRSAQVSLRGEAYRSSMLVSARSSKVSDQVYTFPDVQPRKRERHAKGLTT